MQKLLFIIPPNTTYESFVFPNIMDNITIHNFKNYVYPVTDMPLGIISLSSYLKKYINVEIKLIDFNVIINKLNTFNYESFKLLYIDYFLKELNNFIPDYIGISCLFSTMYFNMIDIANIIKEMFPKSILIAGGGVPTNAYKKIFKDTNVFDALCFGEGEKPLLNLLKSENKKEYFNLSSSWITKEKSSIIFQYDYIIDLDEIPFYDYDLLDLKGYTLNPTPESYFKYKDKSHLFYYATSRGCPNNCCFCASSSVHGKKMRYHSTERVKKDLNILKTKYKAEIVSLQDDHLMFKKNRLEDILLYSKEIDLQLFFQTGVTLKSLDKKTLEFLKNCGFNDLVLPMESGSERVLKEIMYKPVNLSIARQVAQDCRKLDIFTTANIIIGLPGETKKDIEDTKTFLKSIDVNWFKFLIATPLVGSEFYKICIDNKYLDEDFIGGDFKNAIVDTNDFTKEELTKIIYDLNLEINFIENSDMRLGYYVKALDRFKEVIEVKNDHAFAYYFAAKCCCYLKLEEEFSYYKNNYQQIINESVFWKNYSLQFNLTEL